MKKDERLLLSAALTFALLLSAFLPLVPTVRAAPEELLTEDVYFELEYEFESLQTTIGQEIRYVETGTIRYEVVQVTADTIIIEHAYSYTWEEWTDGVLTDSGSDHDTGTSTVDIDTRREDEPVPYYTWLWIPAGVSVGDHIPIEDKNYEVTGSREVKVRGLLFDAWVLRWEETESVPGDHDLAYSQELYYEKTDPIILGFHGSYSLIDYLTPSQSTIEASGWMGDNNIPFDPDGDGLTSWEELDLGTDHRNPDSDGDRLTDGDEVKKHHTDPLNTDTDGDGWGDSTEVKLSQWMIFNPTTPWLPNGLIVGLIALFVVAILLRRRKPPPPPAYPPTPPPPAVAPPPPPPPAYPPAPPPPAVPPVAAPICPVCGAQCTWIPQYSRWYCQNCRQYR